MSLGILEILLVLAVFTILGPRRIANLLRSLGRGVHDFVDALGRDKKNELSEEERDGEDKARD
ncbi:MAG TPA: twin-arginine translocase TatA/TatE family subunit [Rubrobacteraceae bacterium]|jgi:Sec-independent protein translocase protein TatA|nr:twin-arginine translocase TatA/TatE family subunit [Rubrobacteraceae bacterium]